MFELQLKETPFNPLSQVFIDFCVEGAQPNHKPQLAQIRTFNKSLLFSSHFKTILEKRLKLYRHFVKTTRDAETGFSDSVHISYDRHSREQVALVCGTLTKVGFRCTGIEGIKDSRLGLDLSDADRERSQFGIRESRLVLALVTPEYLRNESLRNELRYAIAVGKPIVAVKLKESVDENWWLDELENAAREPGVKATYELLNVSVQREEDILHSVDFYQIVNNLTDEILFRYQK
jgi:hypothetical protein